MYDAVSVAQYVVNKCTLAQTPVTNLKLQKLLYYLWIDFYTEKKENLFNNEICAWPLGPVVPDVYDEFCAYGGLEIRKVFNKGDISEDDAHILNRTLAKLMPISTYQLVNKTHEKGKPWEKVFAGGNGRGLQIPFDMIIEGECR